MKMFAAALMVQLAIGIPLAAHAKPAPAKAVPAVELPDSELHTFRAKDGNEFQLYVSLPLRYDPKSATRYPVVYMTDPHGFFFTVTETVRLLELDGDIAPTIVVGFVRKVASQEKDGHAGFNSEIAFRRYIDLTPMRDPKREADIERGFGKKAETGKGGAYLAVLRDEIIPWVDARYPTSKERALIGYSLGGLFAMYAMFESTDTFTHYLLGSPSMYWNDKVMFKLERDYADKHKDLKARVFISAGVDEGGDHVGSILRLTEALQDRNYPGLELQRDIFPNQIHTQGIGATMGRGLLWLFRSTEKK
jgi:uncharacterized protein